MKILFMRIITIWELKMMEMKAKSINTTNMCFIINGFSGDNKTFIWIHIYVYICVCVYKFEHKTCQWLPNKIANLFSSFGVNHKYTRLVRYTCVILATWMTGKWVRKRESMGEEKYNAKHTKFMWKLFCVHAYVSMLTYNNNGLWIHSSFYLNWCCCCFFTHNFFFTLTLTLTLTITYTYTRSLSLYLFLFSLL